MCIYKQYLVNGKLCSAHNYASKRVYIYMPTKSPSTEMKISALPVDFMSMSYSKSLNT